ncbi:MAG: hypothetical protein ABI091_12415 [Ferruginibacter sp.]
MKKVTLIIILFATLFSAKAQLRNPPIRTINVGATITAQAGTKYFNAKHKARAWLSNTPGKGLTLNFETDANVTLATIETTDKAPYHAGSGNKQTTPFSTPVKKYMFYLDSPAYKSHQAYILSLVTPDVQADAGMYWSALVVRK